MGELEGSVAIVTGSSRGIGFAIAEELAAAGAKVAVTAREKSRAEDAAAALGGPGARGYGCDVGSSEACDELASRVQEDLGPVDVLVNNAGITRDNLLIRLDDEDWQEVLDTNLRGAFYMTRSLARGMMRRRAGSIVNIGSIVGLTGNRGQANYAASKAGLVGLTRSVALELASRSVRANLVAPGFVETDMTADLSEEARDSLFERIPLGRIGKPADVAKMVRFLAGPNAEYVTGQVIVVDGGLSMA